MNKLTPVMFCQPEINLLLCYIAEAFNATKLIITNAQLETIIKEHC